MEDFDLICAIGSGTCGEVSKMKHIPSGRVFAVKVSENIMLPYCIFIYCFNSSKGSRQEGYTTVRYRQ